MRLHEFNKKQSIDILEMQLYELQKYLNENTQFMGESAYDFKEYRDIIDREKLYTNDLLNLIPGNKYAPLSITGTPIGKHIHIFTTSYIVEYSHRTNSHLHFINNQLQEMKFPGNDRDMNDSCIDVLVYNDIQDRSHFLSVLGLTFVGWRIKITTVG